MNMSTRSLNGRRLIAIEQDLETENSQENSGDSPCSFSDNKISSISSSKRRRDAQKRVVSVAIKDVEGFKVKGDHMSAPPSDSWAWRKYGQKPIKGSPYPRGYYKCSSSKGCPARKQVERSKVDPNTMVVTYTCEHNHPWPPSNSRNHQRNIATKNKTSADLTNILTATASVSEEEEEQEQEQEKKPVDLDGNNTTLENHQQQPSPKHKFANISEGGSDFGWFEFEPSTYCTALLECPVLKDEEECNDMNMAFAAREDESLFADLGELPECSTVFRREMDRREVAEQRRHSLHHVAPA